MSTTIRSVSTDQSHDVRRELRERLLSLNFHAFARCMSLVIEKMGGEDVHLAGRRNWKGRNSQGGYDIEATFSTAFGKRSVIIQVKQFDTLPLYQRSIDELRGTCLRVGASEAILITTGSFAPSVTEAQLRLQGTTVAPVRLIAGDTLLDFMVLHSIGLNTPVSSGRTNDSSQAVNREFFDALGETHEGNSRLTCGTSPRFIVSVQVRPAHGRGAGTSVSKRVSLGQTSATGILEVHAAA